MYCNKLMNIIKDPKSKEYNINEYIIKKLDKFLKEKTTKKEREKLNPIKFSIEMDVSEKTSIMLFVLGAKCDLFKIRMYFKCVCGNQFEIDNLKDTLYCSCDREITPNLQRERVFLYFTLLEKPMYCNWFNANSNYQIDYIEDAMLGKQQVSLADFDSIVGADEMDNLVSQRDNKMKQYILQNRLEQLEVDTI